MHGLLLRISAPVILLAALSHTVSAEPLRVYQIGNSWTCINFGTWDIATSLGADYERGFHFNWNQTLEGLWADGHTDSDPCPLKDCLPTQSWDIVELQPWYENWITAVTAGAQMAELAFQGNPDATILIYACGPEQSQLPYQDTWNMTDISDINNERLWKSKKQYELIIDSLRLMFPGKQIGIVPTGHAMAELVSRFDNGETIPGLNAINELFDGGQHTAGLGSYLMDLVTYCTFFRATAAGATPGPVSNCLGEDITVSQETAAYLAELAWDVVKSEPYCVGMDETGPTQAPSGLSANATAYNRVELSWDVLDNSADPESGISGYAVYRDGALLARVFEASHVDSSVAELVTYLYTVAGINGAGAAGPQSSSASATTPADELPPSVVAVGSAGDPEKVAVTFNEPLDQASATTLANYSIDNGVTVLGATLQSNGASVQLTVSTLSPDVVYTVTIDGVKDMAAAGNAQSGASETFEHTPGLPLPAGYVKNILLLEDIAGSPCLPTNHVIGATEISSLAPGDEDIISIGGTSYTWHSRANSTGLWLEDQAADQFVAYGAFTLYNSAERQMKVVYRHDDDMTVYLNGSVLLQASGWDNGAEVTGSVFTMPQGENHVIIQLIEGSGGNHFAVRFVDESDADITDLFYDLNEIDGSTTGKSTGRIHSSQVPRIITSSHGLHIKADGGFSTQVVNAMGKVIAHGSSTGLSSVVIPSTSMGSGVFLVRVATEDRVYNHRVIIK